MEGRKPLAKVEGRRRMRLSGVTVAYRGTPNLDDLRRDAAYACRTLLRTPSFAVGVVSLALAIGTTTAVYGTVEWLLDRPGAS